MNTLEEAFSEGEEDMYALWKAQFPNNFAKDDIIGQTICRENQEWKL